MLNEAELLDTQKIVEEYYAVLRASKHGHVPLPDPLAEAKCQANYKAAFDRVSRILRYLLPRELKALRMHDMKRRSTWREHLSKVQAESAGGEFYAD
jgi:hypothetical protein